MRLAVVERQLIMQGLDITSLVRLASTCKQMRGEALHKEAGKLISQPDPYSDVLEFHCYLERAHAAHASPLFRMHAPVELSVSGVDSPEQSIRQKRLLAKAATFSRVFALTAENGNWTPALAFGVLNQPWIHSVTNVRLLSPQWLTSAAVQHALFALPNLAYLELHFNSQPEEEGQLLEEAVLCATKLSGASLRGVTGKGAALRVAPNLTTMELIGDQVVEPLGSYIWCLPPTITALRLGLFDLKPNSTPRSALKTMFMRLPLLQSLHSEVEEIAPLLQGMLDAGVSALPNLRRVEFDNSYVGDLEDDLLRRFLHKFPTVTVRFDHSQIDVYANLTPEVLAHRFASWPRVEVYPKAHPPPSPHSSDDEPESDVELEEEPADDEQH